MKKIILLIGPKGSGKSYIGSLLEEKFGIKFIRVEDRAIKIKRERNINDEEYLAEVFQAIEDTINNQLKYCEMISFESLGLSNQFDKMIENLRKQHILIIIKILCDPELCIERTRSRDQSMQIIISEDQIREINAKVMTRNYKTDYEISNSLPDKNLLVDELRKILIKSNML